MRKTNKQCVPISLASGPVYKIKSENLEFRVFKVFKYNDYIIGIKVPLVSTTVTIYWLQTIGNLAFWHDARVNYDVTLKSVKFTV